jgi:hypothetical protein
MFKNNKNIQNIIYPESYIYNHVSVKSRISFGSITNSHFFKILELLPIFIKFLLKNHEKTKKNLQKFTSFYPQVGQMSLLIEARNFDVEKLGKINKKW